MGGSRVCSAEGRHLKGTILSEVRECSGWGHRPHVQVLGLDEVVQLSGGLIREPARPPSWGGGSRVISWHFRGNLGG